MSRKIKTLAFFVFSGLMLNLTHPLSSDEGTVLNGAWNILNGKIIYKDFFSFVAPGSYYFVFFSFKLFGVSYWSATIASLLLLLISVYCIYKLTFDLTENEKVAQVAAWIWLFTGSIFYPIVNYNPQSTYIATVAVYMFAAAISKSKAPKFFYSGLFAGLTTVFLQQKGLLLTTFLLAFLAAKLISKKAKVSQLLIFILGSTILFAIATFYFGPKPIYDNLILYNVKHNLAVNFLPLWILFLTVLLTFVAFVAAVRKLKSKSETLFVIFLSQLALLIPLVKRLDIFHLFANIPFLCIFAAVIWLKIPTKLNLQPKFQNLILTSTAFFIIFIVVSFLNIPLTGVSLNIQKKSKSLQIDSFYSHPYQPGLYFELRKPNPYPYDILLTGQFPQEAWQKNLDILKRQNPEFVFLSYDIAKHLKYDKNTALDDYILKNYALTDKVGNLLIMKKLPGSILH